MMYRIASIFLCLCFSFQTLTPFSDSSESGALSHLLAHFQEHQQLEHTSFISFLLLHYSPFSKHSSSNEHRSLPLHTPLSSACCSVAMFLAASTYSFFVVSLQSSQRYLPSSVCAHIFFFYSSIFQPPKHS